MCVREKSSFFAAIFVLSFVFNNLSKSIVPISVFIDPISVFIVPILVSKVPIFVSVDTENRSEPGESSPPARGGVAAASAGGVVGVATGFLIRTKDLPRNTRKTRKPIRIL